MITRRFILSLILSGRYLTVLEASMTKKNITQYGKIFNYLKYPEIRERETGNSVLIVDGAVFIGEKFEKMKWRNILFRNCDFLSNYDIGPESQTDVRYEDCRFTGILSFGQTKNVRFLRCEWTGSAVMFAARDSTETFFESCRFIGRSPDRNQQGGVGSHGDAEFINCYAKWFSLVGDKSLTLSNCECEGASIETDNNANSGAGFLSSKVTIQQCALKGSFNMVSTNMQSLLIRDTQIEYLTLSLSTIIDNALFERVRGGYLNASSKSMRKLTMSQCQIFGRRKKFSFEMGLAAADEVVIDQCNFGSDLNLSVGLGAGGPLENDEWQNIAKNKSTFIRNSTFPVLDASWLESHHLRLENNTIESLDISNSRIRKLDVVDNRISLGVNFKNTQVKESTIQPLAKGQAKLDGSNILLN